MKGLLLKEWYAIRHYYKWMIALLLGLGIYCGILENYYWGVYVMLITSFVPVNLLSMDEKTGWSGYCMALSLSEKQVVASKYVLGIMIMTAELLVCVGSSIVYRLFQGTPIAWESIGVLLEIMITTGIFPIAMTLPICYKFGVDKGRMVTMVTFFVFLIAAGMVQSNLPMNLHMLIQYLEKTLIVTVMILLFVSYKISVAIYERRAL